MDIHAGAQVTKFGGEFADKISHINAQQAEKEGESEVTKLQKEVRSLDSVLLLMRPTLARDVLMAWQVLASPRHWASNRSKSSIHLAIGKT